MVLRETARPLPLHRTHRSVSAIGSFVLIARISVEPSFSHPSPEQQSICLFSATRSYYFAISGINFLIASLVSLIARTTGACEYSGSGGLFSQSLPGG